MTSTPGFNATVYAANTVPGRLAGWTKVSDTVEVRQDQVFKLRTDGRRYRYYLVWISSLPEGNKADILELALKK